MPVNLVKVVQIVIVNIVQTIQFNMEFTKEILQSLYQRAMQFAIASRSEPDKIELTSDGEICAEWSIYHCGEYDYEHMYISPEDLTEDLEEVAHKRHIREEEAKRLAALERQRIQEENARRAKQDRHAKFLELKKEFESTVYE
jgi:hypothetical protein